LSKTSRSSRGKRRGGGRPPQKRDHHKFGGQVNGIVEGGGVFIKFQKTKSKKVKKKVDWSAKSKMGAERFNLGGTVPK